MKTANLGFWGRLKAGRCVDAVERHPDRVTALLPRSTARGLVPVIDSSALRDNSKSQGTQIFFVLCEKPNPPIGTAMRALNEHALKYGLVFSYIFPCTSNVSRITNQLIQNATITKTTSHCGFAGHTYSNIYFD